MKMLGTIYICGDKESKFKDHPIRSFEWFTKAANEKDGESLWMLALFYVKGLGTNKDTEKALECCQLANIYGYTTASLVLSYFEQGRYHMIIRQIHVANIF